MTLRPTRYPALAAAFVVAGVTVYLLAYPAYKHLPRLPRGGALSLLLLVLAEAMLAVSIRDRLAGHPGTKPILPFAVARFAVLAKASSAVGSVLAGAWTGLAVYLLLHRRSFPRTAGTDLVTAGLHVAVSVALVVVALRLEKACRVPDPPPDPEPASTA